MVMTFLDVFASGVLKCLPQHGQPPYGTEKESAGTRSEERVTSQSAHAPGFGLERLICGVGQGEKISNRMSRRLLDVPLGG